MSSGCMEALRLYTLAEILELAEHSTNWIHPRWPHLVGFWRDLLVAAKSGEYAALEAAKMQGIPLLAAEIESGESMRVLQAERPIYAARGNGPPPSRALPCESAETLFDNVIGGGRILPRRLSD